MTGDWLLIWAAIIWLGGSIVFGFLMPWHYYIGAPFMCLVLLVSARLVVKYVRED